MTNVINTKPVTTPATPDQLAADLVAKLLSGRFAKITAEIDTFVCEGMSQPANTLTIRADGFIIAEVNILSPEVSMCPTCEDEDEFEHCVPKCEPYLSDGFILEPNHLYGSQPNRLESTYVL